MSPPPPREPLWRRLAVRDGLLDESGRLSVEGAAVVTVAAQTAADAFNVPVWSERGAELLAARRARVSARQAVALVRLRRELRSPASGAAVAALVVLLDWLPSPDAVAVAVLALIALVLALVARQAVVRPPRVIAPPGRLVAALPSRPRGPNLADVVMSGTTRPAHPLAV